MKPAHEGRPVDRVGKGRCSCLAIKTARAHQFSGESKTGGFARAALAVVLMVAGMGQPALAQRGLLDPDFQIGSGPDGPVTALAVQPDGRILVGGQFTAFNGNARQGLARLEANGALEQAFSVDLGSNGWVGSLGLFPDGKVLVAGSFSEVNGSSHKGMARLHPDGSEDTMFNVGAGVPSGRYGIQPDGKVLLGGTFQSVQSVAVSGLARLETNGQVDLSFIPFAGETASQVNWFSVQPDGCILLCGAFRRSVAEAWKGIARLLPDGTEDSSFQPPASVAQAQESEIHALADKRALLVLYIGIHPRSILRLQEDGTPDESFNLTFPGAVSVRPDPQGRVLVYGRADFYIYGKMPLFRLLVNGSYDWTFDLEEFYETTVVAPQADGKVLIGGSFSQLDGVPVRNLARLLDSNIQPVVHFTNTTHSISEPTPSAVVHMVRGGPTNEAVAIDVRTIGATARPDKDYLEQFGRLEFAPGEQFQSFSVPTVDDAVGPEADKSYTIVLEHPSANARVSAPSAFQVTIVDDDIVDLGFHAESVAPQVMVAQADGKVVVAGYPSSIGGVPRTWIARLNADGSLDTTFDPEDQLKTFASALCLQSDGKLIVGGYFGAAAGLPRPGIVRLNMDGSVDQDFVPGPISLDGEIYNFKWIRLVALQTNGQILAYGDLASSNAPGPTRLVRFGPDGTVDPTFHAELGMLTNNIKALAVQPGGGVLVGAARQASFAQPLIRLLEDGSQDPTFDPLVTRGLSIQVITPQPDGRILVATDFHTCWSGGEHLFRLNPDGTTDRTFHEPVFGPWWCHSHMECDALKLVAVGLQSDGRIVVAGTFTGVNGYAGTWCSTRSIVARFNPDGSLDVDFNPKPIYCSTAFPNPTIYALGLQPDGHVLVSGTITVGSQPPQTGFVRFNPGGPRSAGQATFERIQLTTNGLPQLSILYEGSEYFVIEGSPDLQRWSPLHTNTAWRVVFEWVDSLAAPFPRRFYRIQPW